MNRIRATNAQKFTPQVETGKRITATLVCPLSVVDEIRSNWSNFGKKILINKFFFEISEMEYFDRMIFMFRVEIHLNSYECLKLNHKARKDYFLRKHACFLSKFLSDNRSLNFLFVRFSVPAKLG